MSTSVVDIKKLAEQSKTKEALPEPNVAGTEKIIHVPQGYSARFILRNQENGIKGLYTDGFTTCNILIGINQKEKKIILLHIDIQTIATSLKEIEDEVNWLGKAGELTIVFRPEGNEVCKQLHPSIKSVAKGQQINLKVMDKINDGIYVDFTVKTTNLIHPNVKLYPIRKRPEGLIHHPQERRFLMIQKIGQIIGMRAKHQEASTGKKPHKKQFCIFYGNMWAFINDRELTIDASNKLTKEEMDFFKPEDDFMTIAGKLGGIIDSVKTRIPIVGEIKDIALTVGADMESYLKKNVTCEDILKHNLEKVIAHYSTKFKPNSEEEITFKTNLLKLLNKIYEKDTIEKIRLLINREHQNGFIKSISQECETFLRHYETRKYYWDLEIQREKAIEEARATIQKATENYDSKSFETANSLFVHAIKLLIHNTMEDNPLLSIVFYKHGNNLYEMRHYTEACFLLNIVLNLKKKYNNEDIKQIEEVLTLYQNQRDTYCQTIETNLNLLFTIKPAKEDEHPVNLIMEYCNFQSLPKLSQK